MSPAPGADHPATPESPGLQAAAGDFAAAAVRFARALTGLFGLELRETGAQAMVLGLLAVGVILACVFSYLFLLLGATILLAGWFGGGWIYALLALFAVHAMLAIALALVLCRRARRPLFPGTREALRREVERIS